MSSTSSDKSNMLLNLKESINKNNFIPILETQKSVNHMNLSGIGKGQIKKSEFEDINLENYCNIFRVKHIRPSEKFTIMNIHMTGRYNIIELTNIPQGKFTFKINPLNKDYKKKKDTKNIDNIFHYVSKLKEHNVIDGKLEIYKKPFECNTKKEVHINYKKKDFENSDIEGDYFKNINITEDCNGAINKKISYDHNNLRLIFDNANVLLTINNNSEPEFNMEKLLKKNKKIEEKINKKVKQLEKINKEQDRKYNIIKKLEKNNENNELINFDDPKLSQDLEKRRDLGEKLIDMIIEFKKSIKSGNIESNVIKNHIKDLKKIYAQKNVPTEVKEKIKQFLDKYDTKETFCNLSKTTSGGEILLILVVIYAIYKLLTKKKIIKLFD